MQQSLRQLKQARLFPLIGLVAADVWAQSPLLSRGNVQRRRGQSLGAALPSRTVPGRRGRCYRPSLCVYSGSRGSLSVAGSSSTQGVIYCLYLESYCYFCCCPSADSKVWSRGFQSPQPSFSSFSLTFGILGAEIHLLKAASHGQA